MKISLFRNLMIKWSYALRQNFWPPILNSRLRLTNEMLFKTKLISSWPKLIPLKKTDKNQKNEIKKLINENEKLKKDMSRVSIIRRFTERNAETLNSVHCDAPTQADGIGNLCDKYTVLKSKLEGITDSLLTALDDDGTGFTVISRNKRPSSSHNQPSVGQYEVQPASRPQPLSVNPMVTRSRQLRSQPQPQSQPQLQPQPHPQPRSLVSKSGPW